MKKRRRPRLGQHFLADARYRERIVAALDFAPGDCWVEIGAGGGEMSVLLAQRTARLIAVELDSRLARELGQRLKEFRQATVLPADFLRVDLARLAREAGTKLKIFGNLPYYITTPILKHLFAAADSITEATVLVQREVAERLAAEPGSSTYGALTVFTRFYATPERLFDIPAGAFRPPPEVSSTLVRLRLPGAGVAFAFGEPERFLRFVAACFRSKRKTIANNLRARFGAQKIAATLERLSLRQQTRAEELSIEQLAELWRRLEAG